MNYQNLYNSIISNAKLKPRSKGAKEYFESHHILPLSLNGSNESDNLVLLTAKEHFICHHLLTKIYPTESKLKFAFWAMCNQTFGDVNRPYKVTSTVYSLAKAEFSKVNSIRHKGKKMPQSFSDAWSKRWKENNPHKPGKDSHLFGIPRTDSVKNKISKTKSEHPELNGQYKGDYLTPFGIFQSTSQASNHSKLDSGKIRARCKTNNHLKITRLTLYYNDDLSESDLGKTWSELGYSFIPRSSLTRSISA